MTDGQLLECFVTHGDDAAFAALVRRHGPMVFNVCRRVLRHAQDAEDAFQATFLVLVRKAGSIARRELLGNWLYGVAYRTALEARSAAGRRIVRERQVSEMPEPEVADRTDVWRDLRPLLDQALNRLPEKYRVPVVLCDLEGRTRNEVARQLGIPEGTLSGRLTTARRLLAKRLAHHGLALSAASLATALSQGAASACVPAPLTTSTIEAATAVAAGQVVTAKFTAHVAALAEGVLKTMFITKLRIVAAIVFAAALLIGGGVLAHQPSALPLPSVLTGKRTEPSDADKDAGVPRILKLDARGRRVVWSPDGKTLAVVTKVEKTILGIQYDRRGSAIRLWDVEKGEVRETLAEDKEKGLAFQQVVFSADGKFIAATVSEEVRKPDSIMIRDVIKVWDAKTLELKQTLSDDSQLVCIDFSPDGKLIAGGNPSKKTVMLWNAGTGKLEQTLKNEGAQPWSVAFSPDGKTLLVGGQRDDHSGVVTLWNTETWKLNHTLEREQYVNKAIFSPNGKTVAAAGGGGEVELWNVESGKQITTLQGLGQGSWNIAFSPDGKTLAAGGYDGKVRLWDVETGKSREPLEGHDSAIYWIAYSPDGKTLASVSQDETLRLWRIKQQAGEKK
jgi:RNA polymerase sigma factor (sigma-70 family)